ncbi:unnamed protein product [Oikopleura dioica]|uniref:Protein kinase domain-containing protein n=1 Tax=Oikopleura dioica TaxID=34765 RepID=E4XVZ8_OIKDI|nr:unnamed protein product [Oikopleura dioica]
MEKCDGNLRESLKNGNATLEARKKIATGIKSGLKYLEKIGIQHRDKKLANFLLIGDVAKVCDFGLVEEESERKSYRKLGYTRRGSKYRREDALFAGTPGFAGQYQLGGWGSGQNDYFLYLFCDWKTIWSLNYRPIDEQEKNEIDKIILNCGVQNINNEDHVIKNIKKIISIKNASGSFVLDDPNLTKSCQMSNLKQKMTKCVNLTMQNLTKNILDQKSSNLCVPISVTTLLRFAMKNDLSFVDKNDQNTFDKILTILTMIVYPRSLAGLNLNPKKEESQFQTNDVETLLKRICKKTYLKESGWEIIRTQKLYEPDESTCEFEKVLLNENFSFSRPLTVTGAYFLPARTIDGVFFPEKVFFHQMTLDRIENDEYVLQNSEISVPAQVIKIKKTHPYYAPIHDFNYYYNSQTGLSIYNDGSIKMQLVNELATNMSCETWYLLPQAYSLKLIKK